MTGDGRPRALSLCTGYGGLDIAVEALTGCKIVAYAEFDKHAKKIAAKHYPHAKNFGDIKTIDWSRFRNIDIITAGYPCQPFSVAGKRKGADDPRHLWPSVAQAIREVRPRVVYLENVYGHLTKGFDEVLGTLAAFGYDTQWTCLRAGDIGAPHRRERLFIVATDTHVTRLEGRVRPEPERGSQRSAGESRVEPATPADPGGERHGGRQDGGMVGRLGRGEEGPTRQRERSREESRDRSAESLELLPAPTSSDSTGPGHAAQGGLNLRTAVDRLLPIPTAVQDDAVFNSGTTLQDVEFADLWGDYWPAIERWEALTRPAPDPSEIDEKGKRRLSPLFVEWMMGLPEGWVTDVDIPRTAMLKALGNGVVPQQALAAYLEIASW